MARERALPLERDERAHRAVGVAVDLARQPSPVEQQETLGDEVDAGLRRERVVHARRQRPQGHLEELVVREAEVLRRVSVAAQHDRPANGVGDRVGGRRRVHLGERRAAGDEAAFREIVNRYKNSLYAFLKQFLNQPDLVDDVFQETFLQLFTSRESFDPSRPLRPWLFTIAANKAKDALRKAQRTSAVPIGTIAEPDDMSFDEMLNTLGSDTAVPYDEVERSETATRVSEVIGNMPENLREILVLAYFNRFSYKQMAEILSIPIGTVKSRLHTAVARFAKDWKAAVGSKEVK